MKTLLAALLLSPTAFAGPLDPPSPKDQKFLVEGNVMQVLNHGLLVRCDDNPKSIGEHHPTGTIFLLEIQGNPGGRIHVGGLVKNGHYNYKTVLGAPMTVEIYSKPGVQCPTPPPSATPPSAPSAVPPSAPPVP